MKYINTIPGYILEDYEEIVKIDDENEDNLNNFIFERKHLALIKGFIFKEGSDENKLKKYTAEMSKLVLADTDLNILTTFMNYEMYKKIDLTGIIRASEIDSMYNLMLKNNPKNFKNKKNNLLSKLFSKFKHNECCILFVNYTTRERIFEHIIYDDHPNDNFFMDYNDRGFLPALVLTRDEIEKTFDAFNKIESKEIKLDFADDVFVNGRDAYGKDLTEEEIKRIVDPIYNLKETWKEYKEDTLNDIELIKELKEDGQTIQEFLETMKDSTSISFMSHLEKYKVKYEKDPLPENTFDSITFARNDYNRIIKIFELVSETNAIYSDIIEDEDFQKNIKNKLI